MPTSNALNHVLQDWPHWPILNGHAIEQCQFSPLEQGLTNENWLVTLPSAHSQQFVIRINAKNAASLNIHHQCEFEIVEKMSQLALCPKVLFKDSNYQYWLRPYIRGNTLAELQTSQPTYSIEDDLQQVAEVLKQAHQQATQAHWPSVNTLERTDYFWQQITPSLTTLKHPISKVKALLDNALQSNGNETMLCHMDTNIHNWIKDHNGKLNLIDWEYAGLGNPIWDLAVFSDSANLNTTQETKLLKHYQQYTMGELQIAKQQMAYLSILWFAVQEQTEHEALLTQLEQLAERL